MENQHMTVLDLWQTSGAGHSLLPWRLFSRKAFLKAKREIERDVVDNPVRENPYILRVIIYISTILAFRLIFVLEIMRIARVIV